MKNNAFVFVVCGDEHAVRTNIAIKFLKRFSRSDIIVVKTCTNLPIDCKQVIEGKVPAKFDNRQAGIFLKTSLHRIVKFDGRKYCYLDNDVVAVREDVDAIFNRYRSPIAFAADHCHLRQFSPYAVNCRCQKLECDHLHAALKKQFKVDIPDKKWQHWNGGVFVFDKSSVKFMERWHKNTLSIFKNPHWRTRDQGTLIATVWQLKLENQPVLSREFNFIVDCLSDVHRVKRNDLRPQQIAPKDTYSLGHDPLKPRPRFVHFINGGIGLNGWKNWDDAERLLDAKSSAVSLSADNRVVHGLWIGTTLSRMELLTIRSFLRHGHEFHLWVYDKIETPLPKEVIIEDANQIIPKKKIIKKADTDTETGVGKGSFSSPFSDLFRYKLLYEKGGYWVDMDVTCLRPFNFTTPYLFRTHRVGAVGNIVKCPPKSKLMKLVYEQVSRKANEHSDWLMPNKVLSQMIKRLKLSEYIRDGIWNEESWWEAVRPLALGDAVIPSDWFAIHWINEFWRILKENDGVYRGRRLFDIVPEKDNPKPGSALARLYAEYGLATSLVVKANEPVKQPIVIPLEKPSERQAVTPQFLMQSHINILVPSLACGGAERSVLEILSGLQKRNSSGKLFVLHQTKPSYKFDDTGSIKTYRFNSSDIKAKLQAVALEVLASPEPVVFTHMVKADLLAVLWGFGVKTIPVIQNSSPSWQDAPSAFKHPHVPYLVAVSEAVAQELRKAGCPKPVIVLRHELQRWFSPEEQQQNRKQIRERFGIADDILLIGMVGEFKSQKAYTRAIRVLALIRQLRPVKLMILGGWDHEWGHGREAHAATYRLALDLGVITDLITPGSVQDVEKYYAAFDVFLNTSSFEGLSVALLEAIQTGCPIVTADAGGNREVLPDRAVLVQNSSDINAYAQGIAQALQVKSRVIVQKPWDSDLVPRLWCLMGQYGLTDSFTPLSTRDTTLFVTDHLNSTGTQRSLINLLCHFPSTLKKGLCVLHPVCGQDYLDELHRKDIAVFSLQSTGNYIERVERILNMIDPLKVKTLCFWNLDPQVKLLLAKILSAGSIRLVDVSPDASLFFQMEHAFSFQRRIAFSMQEYWQRLDHFVVKFPEGFPPNVRMRAPKLVVIKDGVPNFNPDKTLSNGLPSNINLDRIIGVVCPVAPGKRIEFLMDMMAELNKQIQGVTLILIGGLEANRMEYWSVLQESLRLRGITNIYFAGPQTDATPFLKLAKVYLDVKEWDGVSYHSLEAMAMGIPVSIKGDPKAMAQEICFLLKNSMKRIRLGAALRKSVAKECTIKRMVSRYQELFDG